MMTSMNEEIAHLASEILFYFAMPTLSVSSYSNDPGWRDNTEVVPFTCEISFLCFV